MTEFVDPPLPFKVPIQIFQPSIPSKCSALTCSCCAASKISSNLAFSGQLIDTNNHLPKKTHRGILRYFVSLIENGWFRIFLPEATGINRHPTAWDSAGPPNALVKSCSTKPGAGESHRGTNGSNGGNGARRTSFAIHLAEPGNLQGQLLKVPQRQALVIGMS